MNGHSAISKSKKGTKDNILDEAPDSSFVSPEVVTEPDGEEEVGCVLPVEPGVDDVVEPPD